ncbi:hypothetical protein MCUN1_001120 [Malassezia cuniculi]|uniref:DNA damage-binding protein CMR1 n=1 Tax=Malassezia cuniculi TaxID=948313 RepID=A0AAF0EX51_9BASI|nr:hypothetical protein MCUN1_001120 [Malassezia cuniculi]
MECPVEPGREQTSTPDSKGKQVFGEGRGRGLERTGNAEQERLQNIAENERLLKELGIVGGSSVLGIAPAKRPNDGDGGRAKRHEKKPREKRILPQRTSARLQGIKLEDVKPEKQAPNTPSPDVQARHGDLSLGDLADLDEDERKALKSTLKVEPEGMLGIWDASQGEATDGVHEGTTYQLRIHTKSIGALRLDPMRQDHHALWVADHKGGLIHIDERAKSVQRWQASTSKIGGMSVWSREPHCIAAASNDRTISLFDVRAMRTLEETKLAPAKLADDDASVSQLQGAARFGSCEYGMACTDVSFSPNGDHLAALSYDDTVSIWETASMYTPKKEKNTLLGWLAKDSPDGQLNNILDQPSASFAHNNKTGKWVTLFRAHWHPNAALQPHFAVGSMERHAEIYAPDGRLLASLL